MKTKETTKPKEQATICNDKKCSVHGKIRTRGRIFEGTVISDKMRGTVNVEWHWVSHMPKYERYAKKRSRVKAHNPTCLSVKKGDQVRIAECRPISKTVNFVVTDILGGQK